MPFERDPLSVRFDGPVRACLLEAAGKKPPRTAERFVSSPVAEFRAPDKGGRTAHERAFQRSVYYQIFKVPRNEGIAPAWSAKVTWGKIERRGTRWGRAVRVRLYQYGRGYAHVAARPASSYTADDALKARPGVPGG